MTAHDATTLPADMMPTHPGEERLLRAVQAAELPSHHLPTPLGQGLPPIPPLLTAGGHPEESPGRHPVELLFHKGPPDETSAWARRYARRCCGRSAVVTLVIVGVHGIFIERFSKGDRGTPELPSRDVASDPIRLAHWIRLHASRTIITPSLRMPLRESLRRQVPITVLCNGQPTQTLETYRSIKAMQASCHRAGHKLPKMRLIGIHEGDPKRARETLHRSTNRIMRDFKDFLGIKVQPLCHLIDGSIPPQVDSEHIAHRWHAEERTNDADGAVANPREGLFGALLEELSAPDGPIPFPSEGVPEPPKD